MKVYKSEWDKFGWRWVIHKTNDGDLKVFQMNNKKGTEKIKRQFDIWEDGRDLLDIALLDD